MIVLLVILVFLAQSTRDTAKANFEATVNNFEDLIVQEVQIGYTVEDGYKREFTIPKSIMGSTYNLSIENSMILVVKLQNQTFARILPGYVLGGICLKRDYDPTRFHLMISKNAGLVSLSACPDCGYSYAVCDNADRQALCDQVESLFPGFRQECCEGHCKCC